MNLVVDGIIYKYQKHGGISRMFSEILPRMCNIDPALKIKTLLQPDASLAHLPKHSQIAYKSIPEPGYYLRPYRLWKPYYPKLRQWSVRFFAGFSSNKVWLSTYYTTPSLWRGKQVVVAYDFIYERYRQEHWQDDIRSADAVIRNKARAIRNADLVICISETTRQDLLSFYHEVPVEKTAVVHLSHSSIFHRLGSVRKPDKKFILYVGGRKRYKGFDTLLNAFADWSKNQEIDLVCVGGGDWDKFEVEKITSLGLQDNVQLLNSVDDHKLCELYNQASAFVYPSEYEGFGIPLLEAMACGCPVVASYIPSTLEVAQDVPYYFSSNNQDELKSALEQAFADNRAMERREKGELLANQYSWDRTAREYWSLLSKLMKE